MSYISEIFNRINIQNIREFLINGVDCVNVSEKTYLQRIAEAEKSAIEMIHTEINDKDKNEKILDEIFDYAGTIQNVYMEIGLQCGFILAAQLLTNPKTINN